MTQSAHAHSGKDTPRLFFSSSSLGKKSCLGVCAVEKNKKNVIEDGMGSFGNGSLREGRGGGFMAGTQARVLRASFVLTRCVFPIAMTLSISDVCVYVCGVKISVNSKTVDGAILRLECCFHRHICSFASHEQVVPNPGREHEQAKYNVTRARI